MSRSHMPEVVLADTQGKLPAPAPAGGAALQSEGAVVPGTPGGIPIACVAQGRQQTQLSGDLFC